MQCPSCQKENVAGHSYCTYCRAELQVRGKLIPSVEAASEVETMIPAGNRLRPFGRILRRLFSAFLLFVVIALLRGINWEQVMRGISQTKTGVERAIPKAGQDPAPRKADDQKNKTKKSTDAGEASDALLRPRWQQEIVADTSSITGLVVEPVESSIGKQMGGLTIQRGTTHAKIYIDGHFSGYTPTSLPLSAGTHRISLMADGYEEWRRTIQVKESRSVTLNPSLTKIARQ